MSESQKLKVQISGMTCDSCASHVRDALRGVAGVTQVDVPGWKQGIATLLGASSVAESDIVEVVSAAGYRAKVMSRSDFPTGKTDAKADFDLIVIGTGGAGMAAAIKAAEMGFRAAIVEAGVVGGTCVNVGCVPSKALLRAAEAAHVAGHHPFAGVNTRLEGVDWSSIIQQKNDLVESLRQHKYEDVINAYPDNIELIRGWAKLEGGGAVTVDGKQYRGRKIVITTGARPKMLPIPGADEVNFLDSTSAMELTERPESLLIIGGRFIALEQAQLFARPGTKVTVLQRSERLIPDHEPEISEAIAEYFREEGIDVKTDVNLLSVREEDGQKALDAEIGGLSREFRADQVLMAVGRRANTENLGLDKVGVALDDSGAIIVDDALRSSNPDIYAAGDVTNRPQLIYVAATAGGIAADNALSYGERKLDLATLPDVIFTDPQIAQVGLTEAQATAQGYAVKTTVLPLKHVPRAIAARNTRGLIKLVADEESDRLLGASVLAAEGGEVIQTAAMAVHCGQKYGFTVQDLREMLFPSLVQEEGLKLAALTFEKDVSQLSCCAA